MWEPKVPASPGLRRCSMTAFMQSWQQPGGCSLPVCSTMRGRAEYESACQEGPQAPEEEDHDARTQVRPGSQEARSCPAATRRLHPCRNGHPEEAELGAAQDRPC